MSNEPPYEDNTPIPATATQDTPSETTPEAGAWWTRSLSRRDLHKAGLGAALLMSAQGLGLSGCNCDGNSYPRQSREEALVEKVQSALDVQKEGGWNIGYANKTLTFPGNFATKGSTGLTPRQLRESYGERRSNALRDALRPKQVAWRPYERTTLAQSMSEATLTASMGPYLTEEMKVAFNRGASIASLLVNTDNPEATLLIVDVPGPQAVALAAGMADSVEPVFYFDNWPHPVGVVPSHLTLGALLYYIEDLEKSAAARGDKAPVALILDRNRLTTYQNEATQFDNRYVADLPSSGQLSKLGITRMLYVTEDDNALELDDLNDAMAELHGETDLDVSQLPLDAFEEDPEAPDTDTRTRRYYYGGNYHSHTHFYGHYGAYPYHPMPGFIWISTSSSSSRKPRKYKSKPKYKPSRRSTMFSSSKTGGARGVGRVKPSGFGRVSTRTTSSGKLVGTRHGSTPSRNAPSGSYGRSSGGSGG